jgi:hypothetical protein
MNTFAVFCNRYYYRAVRSSLWQNRALLWRMTMRRFLFALLLSPAALALEMQTSPQITTQFRDAQVNATFVMLDVRVC